MNRFEIIDNEAGHERLRKLLGSGGYRREWQCSLKVGGRKEGLEIWARRALPTIIPWMEQNRWHQRELEAVENGLREWRKITDTAIVTTVPGARIYGGLCSNVLNMQIIPGLKTNDLLPFFDVVDGWEEIGKELTGMAEATGSKIVVLENESAVEQYRLGNEAIKWDQFRKCLAMLPKDLTIWWYPAMTGANDEEQDRMEELCSAVSRIHPNVVLLDHQSRGGPRGLTYSWSIKGRDKLDKLAWGAAGTSILPMLYFYGPKEPYWQDHQILEALEAAGSDEVIIYPGAARWEEAAKLFVKALGTSPVAESKTISGE